MFEKGRITISIHASAKEATVLRAVVICLQLKISIHASAKEATGKITSSAGLRTISIHASAKEATICSSADKPAWANFNPRLREGGDALIHGQSFLF